MLDQRIKPSEATKEILLAATSAGVTFTPPPEFALVSQRKVTADGVPATLIRHERRDRRNACSNGEHFSLVIGESGALLGMTRMDLDLSGGALPSRARVAEVASTFLKTWAPDLPPVMDVKWIEPHDEVISSSDCPRTLTGMKVKCFNTADGRWFWVIVGAGDVVITFERDIVWLMDLGRRQTEKWLPQLLGQGTQGYSGT